MLIRISRRNYKTYSYSELMLITYLCVFGSPVGVTELMCIRISRRSYITYSYTEIPLGTTRFILILVFRILYLSYRAFTYLTDLILALQNMYLSYRSYTCFTDTGEPVGTTELILILPIREHP